MTVKLARELAGLSSVNREFLPFARHKAKEDDDEGLHYIHGEVNTGITC